MAPVLLPPDPARTRRLESARRSGEFIARNSSKYRGRFLVVHDGNFIAAETDPTAALEKAREAGLDPRECVVQYVPAEGSLLFF